MENNTRLYINEGVPLNSSISPNILINTDRSRNQSTKEYVINLNPGDKIIQWIHTFLKCAFYNNYLFTLCSLLFSDKRNESIAINATLSIPISKKVKYFLLFNLSLGLASFLLSSGLGYYFWKENLNLRTQLDIVKNQLIQYTVQDPITLPAYLKPERKEYNTNSMKKYDVPINEIKPSARRIIIHDNERDPIIIDTSNDKNNEEPKMPVKTNLTVTNLQGMLKHIFGNSPYLKTC